MHSSFCIKIEKTASFTVNHAITFSVYNNDTYNTREFWKLKIKSKCVVVCQHISSISYGFWNKLAQKRPTNCSFLPKIICIGYWCVLNNLVLLLRKGVKKDTESEISCIWQLYRTLIFDLILMLFFFLWIDYAVSFWYVLCSWISFMSYGFPDKVNRKVSTSTKFKKLYSYL